MSSILASLQAALDDARDALDQARAHVADYLARGEGADQREPSATTATNIPSTASVVTSTGPDAPVEPAPAAPSGLAEPVIPTGQDVAVPVSPAHDPGPPPEPTPHVETVEEPPAAPETEPDTSAL